MAIRRLPLYYRNQEHQVVNDKKKRGGIAKMRAAMSGDKNALKDRNGGDDMLVIALKKAHAEVQAIEAAATNKETDK